jgi:4'-phosphopantetheinyl transferase EntD
VSADGRVAAALAALADSGLFDDHVHVLAGRISAIRVPLFPEEIIAIADAVPRRVAEFTAGRALARRAMLRAGGESVAIPTRADRSPIWPRGWVGSISHSGDVCAAVAASAEFVCSLGLDIELNDLADERMLRYVCAPEELSQAREALTGPDHAPRILFSAKEAFYKAYHPLFARFVDFLDVRVNLFPGNETTSGTFSVEPVSVKLFDHARYTFAGRWKYTGGVVLAGVTCLRR